MGASPEDSCSFFELAATKSDSVLLCPRGPAKRAMFDEALGKISPRLTGTLIGFSIGARFALDTALREPGKWPALILMSQKMSITTAMLDKAGVRRVVLGAGELDQSFATMKKEAENLGDRARFVSLGKVSHHFAVDMDTRMAEAVAWVNGS